MANNSNKLIEIKDFLFIWRLFIKNISVIIIIPLLAYAVGYLYTYRLTNIYGAKVQMLLKSNETYDYQDPIYKGLGAYGIYMDVQNQIRIIKSRDLLGEVVDKLPMKTSYYVVGRLQRKEVFGTLPFQCDFQMVNPAMYENPVKVKILSKNDFSLDYQIGGKEKIEIYQFGDTIQNGDVILTLSPKYTFDDNNIEVIKASDYELVFHSREYLIQRFKYSLSVENIEHTSILDIAVTDPIQTRAKMFLDTLAAVYINYSTRAQLELNKNTIENIDRQIDTIQGLLAEKETELLLYKNNNSVLSPVQEQTQYFQDYITFSAEKRTIEKKLNSVSALEKYLSDLGEDRVLPPFFYIEESDFYLSKAINDVRKLQVELDLSRTKFSDDNFTVKSMKNKIDILESDILNYLSNLKSALNIEMAQTEVYIEKYKADIKKLPRSEQDILNIQRELDVKNKMYLFLLEKRTNTRIARAGIIPQVQIIESAISVGIVEPDKAKLVRLFVLSGFVLAFLIAIIRKLFFEKITSVDELASSTELNVVGGIPYVKKNTAPIVVYDNPKAHVTESFRTLRSNISYLGKAEKNQVIVVSSFFPGEGKTFSSSNLAALMSMGDKKVILLDFDLHKPRVHKMFNLSNDKGVSSYLVSKNNIDEIVQKNVLPNFDLVCAGPVPPNPSELILKNRTEELIDWAKSNYDYVIVDTPPFGLLNDGIELLKLGDVFLVILNTHSARKRGVNAIEDIIENKTDISVGMVLNGIKQSGIQYYYAKYTYKYSYSRYGYGYGYGYGSYGDQSDAEE